MPKTPAMELTQLRSDTPDANPATGRGALRAWSLRVAGRRLLRRTRLLLLVITVAVLASIAVTAVGLLVSATEQSAIRTSLQAIPTSQTSMSVFVNQPKLSLAATTTRINRAIRSVLGNAATAHGSIRSFTVLYPVATPKDPSSLGYFGELANVADHVTLTSGVLPNSEPAAGASTVQVAIPEAAATRLGLRVGSTLPYAGAQHPVTLDVVGIYSLSAPGADYWSQDPLNAAGNVPGYLSPTGDQTVPVDAFGPMLVSHGSLDAIGVLADRVELDYAPSFAQTQADELDSLISRVGTADSAVPADAGDIAEQVTYSGAAAVPLGQIASALVVTRSTVVVVTLLLLVLSIAALAQAARLFNDARAGDRELMRARGASRGQLLAISVLEAGLVGAVVAIVSAPLARAVYFAVASQPAMVAARVPRDSGLPASAWLTSVALGVVFVLVLLFSLVGPSASFVGAEQTKSRGRRAAGLLRSGLDLGVVVIAGIAFWQLSIYRSPVGASGSLSVDPVLVSAPALVLLAGSLLAARLFPLLARLIDAAGSKSSGVLFRLASWEIGRRSQRATAVVLLLTLALAVGTFSETFLATWQQSQVDQSNYAVGPPVRVPAVAADGGAQRSLLTQGATGSPQPVIRRIADVAEDAGADEDTQAVVLGLNTGARALLDRGQQAKDGGALIASRLKDSAGPAKGITLPGNPSGLAATVQVGETTTPLIGVAADVRAIVEDGAGLLTTVDLGDVPVDGAPHPVSGMLPDIPGGSTRPLPLRFVGLQAEVNLSNPATYQPNPPIQTRLLLGQLASLTPSTGSNYSAHPAAASAPVTWNAVSADDSDAPAKAITVAGQELALAVTISGDVQTNPAVFAAVGWPPIVQVPVVISTSIARLLDLPPGGELELSFATASVSARVVGMSALVPGAVDTALLTPGAAAGADATGAGAVVVDQTALERVLVQGGESGSTVDEWWVDVAPGTAAAYLRAHSSTSQGGVGARASEVLALQMQQDPLRVATQAALWLAIGAAALLAAIGFAVHSSSTLAARRIELAQLRAIGLSRRRLVRLIATESALLSAVGVLFEVAVGILLGILAGPLIALSPNGTPAVPSVRVIVPGWELVALVLVVVIVMIAVVGAVARGQRSANPANILREADNG